MPPSSSPRTSVYLWLIIILAFLIIVVLAYRLSSVTQVPPSTLRRLSDVPPFVLTERSGRTITNHDLSGKIWVADFIFTTCPGPCPEITANMAKLQIAVANDPHVQLVTFTVDPQDDTPSVLAAYADKYDADHDRWWFLTGPEKPLYALIQDGFHLGVQDNHGQTLQDGQYVVTHSTQLALVDGSGVVRGYYKGDSPDDRVNLLRDIKVLEKEENP